MYNSIELSPERGIIPDAWVILKIIHGDDVVIKILSGFNGGYLNSNSWRLSGNVINSTEDEKCFQLVTETGSTYTLLKTRIGFASESGMYYQNIKKAVDAEPSFSCILGDNIPTIKQILEI